MQLSASVVEDAIHALEQHEASSARVIDATQLSFDPQGSWSSFGGPHRVSSAVLGRTSHGALLPQGGRQPASGSVNALFKPDDLYTASSCHPEALRQGFSDDRSFQSCRRYVERTGGFFMLPVSNFTFGFVEVHEDSSVSGWRFSSWLNGLCCV